jgi:hypothetical protein
MTSEIARAVADVNARSFYLFLGLLSRLYNEVVGAFNPAQCYSALSAYVL